SQYESAAIERRCREIWKKGEVYHFDPKSDKPVYSIDNPPRYASGALHLGHAVGYSLIDFVARYKRMNGYNVFFPLCFDVNGTPIEIKVEKKYGITKLDTPRDKYRELCEEFADEKINQMIYEFEMLGESMDPSIYYRTDAKYYRKITQLSFVDLFKKGLVYKGNYPVNWCPSCMTALADAEVEYKNNINKLNYVNFQIADEEGYVCIATTRPELLCTCKAVAVHPDDAEKEHLVGKELITPIFKRKVKIISDPKVKMDYGTGIVMICTIGDKDDLEWVMKYHFEMEKGIDEAGKMTDLAGKYAGMPVIKAREAVIEDLVKQGLIIKQEDNPQQVSTCWRCHEPIEYLQVPQWFLKTLEFKEQVLEMADHIKWFPEFMKIRLQDWVNSLQWDWVIGRQRIFATPIPIWECKKCGYAVCATEEMCYCDPVKDGPPVDKCPKCECKEFLGCTDVFDTWMDSSGSALYNTYWGRDTNSYEKLYPMSLRPQSHDIIRTWAFYTILRSYQLTGKIPWKDIMIHGFIMAPDGTPMHSSIGNTIEPIPILDRYGADALRYYASTCSLGIDHAFREKDVVRGRRLCNKIFNIGQFAKSFLNEKPTDAGNLRLPDKWIISRFTQTVELVTDCFEVCSFDKAMKSIESFIWHDIADHYIEMIKPRRDVAAEYTLYNIFLGTIKLLAPFMPYVTESIYRDVFYKHEGAKSIHLTSWPKPIFTDSEAERAGNVLKDIIAAIRRWKSERKIPLNADLQMIELIGEDAKIIECAADDVIATIRANKLQFVKEVNLVEEYISAKPVYEKIGPKFKKDAGIVAAEIARMKPNDIARALVNKSVKILVNEREVALTMDYLEFEKRLTIDGRAVDTLQLENILIAIEK
ncbi:MAG: valine--tRNA ligase, partial [archaeon]|nr:valine--tRNA ligase [archaeon]